MPKKIGWRQGTYSPKNPQKYRGNVNDIVYRSSWELTFCQFLDSNPNVISWGSEILAIPYVKPTTGRVHRYFIDFYVEYINKHGEVVKELIEVKPDKQTKRSTARSRKTRTYEDITFAINQAKWEAAEKYAKTYGMSFKVLTEKNIYR